jgi:hypothetical protein
LRIRECFIVPVLYVYNFTCKALLKFELDSSTTQHYIN